MNLPACKYVCDDSKTLQFGVSGAHALNNGAWTCVPSPKSSEVNEPLLAENDTKRGALPEDGLAENAVDILPVTETIVVPTMVVVIGIPHITCANCEAFGADALDPQINLEIVAVYVPEVEYV